MERSHDSRVVRDETSKIVSDAEEGPQTSIVSGARKVEDGLNFLFRHRETVGRDDSTDDFGQTKLAFLSFDA